MPLSLSIPDPETTKVKEIASKVTVSSYRVYRNVELGVMASHIAIDVCYGNEKEQMDPVFLDTPLFSVFRTDVDYVNNNLGELFLKLQAIAVQHASMENPPEDPVTSENITEALGLLKAADDANTNAILAFIGLLEKAGLKSLPNEEISRLV